MQAHCEQMVSMVHVRTHTLLQRSKLDGPIRYGHSAAEERKTNMAAPYSEAAELNGPVH